MRYRGKMICPDEPTDGRGGVTARTHNAVSDATWWQRRMSRGAGGLQPPRVGQHDFFSGNLAIFRATWQFFGPKNCQIAPDFSGKIDSAPP